MAKYKYPEFHPYRWWPSCMCIQQYCSRLFYHCLYVSICYTILMICTRATKNLIWISFYSVLTTRDDMYDWWPFACFLCSSPVSISLSFEFPVLDYVHFVTNIRYFSRAFTRRLSMLHSIWCTCLNTFMSELNIT